jgi:subfamily B ATP-binding cassette protein MsbA
MADAPRPRLYRSLPHVWALLKPRRLLLAGGFLLMLLNRGAELVLPASTKYLIDDVIGRRHLSLLTPLLGAVLAATLVQAVSTYALTQILSKEAQRLIAQLRLQVQKHVGRLPLSFFDANRAGTLTARIMSDVEGVRNLIGTGLIQFLGGLLTALLALIVLLRISPLMTVLALGFILTFTTIVRKAFATIRPIFRERRKINADVTGRLTESLGGVRVVKGYRAEEREHQVFAAGVQRLLQNVFDSLTATSLMSLSSSVLVGVVAVLVMEMGTHQILRGHMTLGDFVTYNLFLAYLVAPMAGIVNIGTQLTEAVAGLERTHEVLQERPEDHDPRRAVQIPGVHGAISFEHVSFAYQPGKPVLHDVSFHAEPGTVTALVGSSGSGKSTIIGLISAFYIPDEGRILMDGLDLATVRLDNYRSHLGLVLQESFLFDGTIWENVAFSRPDATSEQILEACRIARVDEFAERLEQGYDTIVGERGVKLSGGQRQRVSIARAILADPAILILDEATSSLDSESEALIQHGLSHLMRGRTTFVIAHRLSTIRSADQILVIEEGRIVERGSHPELYAQRGRYYDLYTRQHGLQTNLFLAPGEGDAVEEAGSPEPATLEGRRHEG